MGIGESARDQASAIDGAIQALRKHKSAEEALFAQVSALSSGPRLDRMTFSFNRELEATLQVKELFRVYLLAYAAALLIGVGYLGVRLKGANESLERRVIERTRELSEALRHLKKSETQLIQSEKMSSLGLQQTVAEAVTIALELADAKTAPQALPQKMSQGVLVIDSGQDIFRVAKALIGGRCPVLYANSLEAALDAMQSQEIAVVLTDVEADHEDTTAMLKLLKQENPQILSIVLTSASDSELVIRLINEAQVFRFLSKPVNVGLLKQHVEAALARYLAFQQAPQLLRQHQVQRSGAVRDFSVGQKILSGLKLLRGRWFGAGKKS